MAVDINEVIENLLDFYDFKDRTIISVGAGGGQLIEYGRMAKKVFAIDSDENSLRVLKTQLTKTGLKNKYDLYNCDFYGIDLRGDVVLFEFCLHEMIDATAAVKHAQNLAADIIVFDHLPGSEWAYITAEDQKVVESWSAVETFSIRKFKAYETVQFFKNYDELYQKVKVQGEKSVVRIQKFKSFRNFTIPMHYGIALI